MQTKLELARPPGLWSPAMTVSLWVSPFRDKLSQCIGKPMARGKAQRQILWGWRDSPVGEVIAVQT